MKALLLSSALSVVAFPLIPTPPTVGQAGVPFVDPMYDVEVYRDVPFGSVLNLSTNQVDGLKLDLYLPVTDGDEGRPVVFWVHGGGFTGGDKTEMENYCRYFAVRGYVAIAPNYRLVSPWDRQNLGATYASSDVMAAVRWVRHVAGIWNFDTQSIALCGMSSGAFAALGASYDQAFKVHNPNWANESMAVAACVDISGRLYNLPSMESGEVPLMVVHGVLDPVVPFAYALDLIGQAHRVGVYEEHLFFSNLGHALMRTSSDLILESVSDFLYRKVLKE